MMKIKINKAFTLAEVLITLGIIGVVAAMTMPTLIAKYQKQQTVVQLKKIYATVSSAIKMSEVENGSTEYWDYTGTAEEFYNKYLKKYLKTTEAVPHSEIKKKITYQYMNGTKAVSATQGAIGNPDSYTAKLSDGSFVLVDAFFSTAYAKRNIVLDINGYTGPNQIGKDVFYFTLEGSKHGFVGNDTVGHNNIDGELVEVSSCLKNQSGYGCSSKIMEDGWEIKDDYPW